MNYSVTLEGEELPVRTAGIYPSPYHENSIMEYVQFVRKGPVTLRIHSEKKVESAVVRPLSRGIKPRIEEGDILLSLEGAAKLSLEINGSSRDNLLVLAEEEHYGDFRTKETEVICFPPGIHEADLLTVEKDHTVVYLEEGAYLHGKITLSHCSHVTVCGYGVISMEKYPYETRPVYARCVDAIECRDVTIRDITIADSNDWSLRICGCEDVLVENVKIFGCRGNSDGIDICGSRRVLVKKAFTRVWDDSLVVKALDTGDVEDVTFESCILWNDFARPMEVGVELRADQVHRVRFRDIDVLHSPTGYPLMGIHHGDRALVSDIVFEDIRVEDAPGAQLFDIRITPSYWNRDTKMGRIRDVAFRNIRVEGNPGLPLLMSDSRLQGYDEEHDIQGVSFENIDICGRTPKDAEALPLECRDYVGGVHFLPDPRLPLMEPVETGVEVTRDFTLRGDGLYEGEIALILHNTAPFPREKEIWLKISPEHLGRYDREKRRVALDAGEVKRIVCPVVLQPGKYVAAIQSEDPEVRYAWRYLALDLHLTGEGAGGALEFVNYWGDRPGQVKIWKEGDELVLESPLLLREDCRLVLHAARPVDREPGEVMFSVEETDLGQVPAVLNGRHGPEAAPQLRCPLEITLVFKNQPKVREIRSHEICGGSGSVARVPLKQLGLSRDSRHFWLEAELRLPELARYRCPCTLFHSVTPLTAAHMYGNCVMR